jgi:hypothetical protein
MTDQFLRNTHDTLKWLWLVMMTAALATSVKKSYLYLENFATDPLTWFARNEYQPLLFYALGFMPSFLRFFIGNSRYLDLSYLEFTFLKEKPGAEFDSYLKKYSWRKRLYDVIMLITLGIFFVFLGQSVSSPIAFMNCYFFLWAFNVVTLYFGIYFFTDKSNTDSDFGLALVGYNESNKLWKCLKGRHWAAKIWIVNNALHMALFVVLLNIIGCSPQDNWIIYLGLILTNSAIDVNFTLTFYLPDAELINAHCKKELDTNSSMQTNKKAFPG